MTTSIAFDFDGTILSDFTALHAFIRNNYEEMRFVIITHRDRIEAHKISNELKKVDLDISMFERVISCPERILLGFSEAEQMRRISRLPRVAEAKNLFPGELDFVTWKGKMARRLRCQVLVDDIPWLSRPGCEETGVKFIPAKDFPDAL